MKTRVIVIHTDTTCVCMIHYFVKRGMSLVEYILTYSVCRNLARSVTNSCGFKTILLPLPESAVTKDRNKPFPPLLHRLTFKLQTQRQIDKRSYRKNKEKQRLFGCRFHAMSMVNKQNTGKQGWSTFNMHYKRKTKPEMNTRSF